MGSAGPKRFLSGNAHYPKYFSERKKVFWSFQKDAVTHETLANNNATKAVHPRAFGSNDGIAQTAQAHGMRATALRQRMRTLPLFRIRPRPWKPEEDHAFALSIQGQPRIPGRCITQRARRSEHNPQCSQAEDAYLLDAVPRFNETTQTSPWTPAITIGWPTVTRPRYDAATSTSHLSALGMTRTRLRPTNQAPKNWTQTKPPANESDQPTFDGRRAKMKRSRTQFSPI